MIELKNLTSYYFIKACEVYFFWRYKVYRYIRDDSFWFAFCFSFCECCLCIYSVIVNLIFNSFDVEKNFVKYFLVLLQ